MSKLQPVTEHLEQPSTAMVSGHLRLRNRDFARSSVTLDELCLSLDFGLPDGGINLLISRILFVISVRNI